MRLDGEAYSAPRPLSGSKWATSRQTGNEWKVQEGMLGQIMEICANLAVTLTVDGMKVSASDSSPLTKLYVPGRYPIGGSVRVVHGLG